MYAFKIHRPTTVRQAAGLLQREEEPKLLAGGHTLIPTMKLRLAGPKHIVDMSQIEDLAGIEEGARTLIIGAMTFARVTRSKSNSPDDESAEPRVTGTVIAIVGAVAMLASPALAWSRPAALTALGFANGLVFLGTALAFCWPAMQIGAAASLTVGVATAFLVRAGKRRRPRRPPYRLTGVNR